MYYLYQWFSTFFSTGPHYGPSASLTAARMSFTYYVINSNQPDL